MSPEATKVVIRGAGGLLGHRLYRAVANTQPDMCISAVVLGTDEVSFRRFEQTHLALRRLDPDLLIIMDAGRKKIAELCDEWCTDLPIQPLDQCYGQLNDADAIVDCAIVPGKDGLADFYDHYGKSKPVIHQSGTSMPNTVGIAPPFEPQKDGNFENHYRQGDCLVSGIAPILYPLRDKIEAVNLTLLVQRQTRLNDYTLRDNLDDILMNPKLEERVQTELMGLFPNLGTENISAMVFESPGHDDYACIFKLMLTEEIDKDELIRVIRDQPRVIIAPPSVGISTSQFRQRIREPFESSGKPVQPIVCFSANGGIVVKGREVTMRTSFYSKAITMLPNIDSVRGLVRKMPMIEAMRRTDQNFGYKK